MKYIRSLFAFAAAACLGACSNAPDPAPLETIREGKPALWKVTGTKPNHQGTAYMFGTIHLLPDDVNWQSKTLSDAMTASDTLVIEVLGLEDTQAAAKIFARLGLSAGLPDVEQRVKPSLRPDAEKIIEASGIPEFALNRMETWAAALSLASAQTNNLGLTSGQGVEKVITAKFTAMKKPVEGLETIEQQLGYFDQLPEERQRQMLTSVVEEAGETKAAFEELFNAWITGNITKLNELSDGGIIADSLMREKLLVARNADWTEQLDKKLQQSGTLFVAVGAAHLVGVDSVQSMLEKRGYKVEKIQ